MTLFSRVRTLPAEAPSARLLMGRVKVEMLRRT